MVGGQNVKVGRQRSQERPEAARRVSVGVGEVEGGAVAREVGVGNGHSQ